MTAATNGIIGVNKKGQVLSVNVNEQTIIPHILTILNNTELAFKLASRGNLPGAGNLYINSYSRAVDMVKWLRSQPTPQEYDCRLRCTCMVLTLLSVGNSTHNASNRVV